MRKPFARLCAVATLMLATGAIAATPAMAEFGFKDLDVTFTNQDGTPVTQAGSHPYAVTTSLDLNRKIDPKVGETIDDATKDLIGFQIPGLVGEPAVTPRCATRDFLTRNVALEGLGGYPGPECSDSSAVGMTVIRLSQDGVFGEFEFPVFNLEAPPGVAMKVGFWVIGVPITLELGVNSSPPTTWLPACETSPRWCSCRARTSPCGEILPIPPTTPSAALVCWWVEAAPQTSPESPLSPCPVPATGRLLRAMKRTPGNTQEFGRMRVRQRTTPPLRRTLRALEAAANSASLPRSPRSRPPKQRRARLALTSASAWQTRD